MAMKDRRPAHDNVIMRTPPIFHGHWWWISWSATSSGTRLLSSNSRSYFCVVENGASASLRRAETVCRRVKRAGSPEGAFKGFDRKFSVHHSFQVRSADRVMQIANF